MLCDDADSEEDFGLREGLMYKMPSSHPDFPSLIGRVAEMYNDSVAMDVLHPKDAAVTVGHVYVNYHDLGGFLPAGSFLDKLNLI